MSNRIEVRGVIVSGLYDDEWFQPYIERGLITPETRVRAGLKAADPAQPIDLYINSPGGSVFDGYEMANSVRDWAREHGQAVNVTVGAMAASAASYLALSVAPKLKLHRNSKLMFHGASTGAEGGAEALADTAELLGKINAEIKTMLVSRYAMDPATVDGWFAEGRMGWITAAEAQQAGMVSEVVDSDGEVLQFADADLAALDNRGLAVAALLEDTEDDDGGTSEPGPGTEGAAVEDGDGGAVGDDGAPTTAIGIGDGPSPDYAQGYDEGFAAGMAGTDAAYDEGREVGRTEGATEARAQLTQELTAARAELEAAHKRANALADELTHAGNRYADETAARDATIADLKVRLARLVAGGMAAPEDINAGPGDWRQALQACGGDYVAARKRHPGLYAEYMRQATGRR